MRLTLTIIILLSLILTSNRFGGKPERIVSFLLVLMFSFGFLYRFLFGSESFTSLNLYFFLSECIALFVMGWIALTANRVWPLAATAFQTIIVSTHLATWAGPAGMRGVYWAMTTIPTYLQYAVLGGGIAMHRRRLARALFVPDWRAA